MAKVGDFIDELYKNRYEKMVSAFYKRYKKQDVSRTDIEDIFQEVILYMLQKEDLEFETEAEVFVYLRRGMYCRINNFISRYLARHKFVSGVLIHMDKTETTIDYEDFRGISDFQINIDKMFGDAFIVDDNDIDINKIISESNELLTDFEKELFEFRFLDGMNYDQIAYELKMSKRNISRSMKDIIDKLRKEYK